MFDNIINFFKKFSKETKKDSKDMAKERLHLVLMQDRANVSADYLEMMKQEIIEVIKKYIDVDENSIDVKLTNKVNSDGTTGAPALYANIPIISLKDETKKTNKDKESVEEKESNIEKEEIKEETENKEEQEIENSEKQQESTNTDETEQEEKEIIQPEESIKVENEEDNIEKQEDIQVKESEEKTEVE